MHTRKWMFLAVIAVLGVVAFTTTSYAYEETNALGKLSRGITNIVTSPIEIFRNIYIRSQEENIAYGMTVGLGTGVVQTLVRCGAGIVETVTFPLNFPDEYKDPLVDPEYVWEEWY